MVLAIAALAAVGLLIVDVAGMTLLGNQLTRQVDSRLQGFQGFQDRRPQGQAPPPRQNNQNPPSFGPTTMVLRVNADGSRSLVNPTDTTLADQPLLGSVADLQRHLRTGRPYTVDGTKGAWRVMVRADDGGTGYLVMATSIGYIQSVQSKLLVIDVAVSALVLLLIGLAAATLVRIGLRPLTRMEQAATAIAGGDLSRRVQDADPHTESGRLGTALNTMLMRIEESLEVRTASERRMRQFLADASHELRTPLTSIQGFAELYRRGGAPPGPELDEAMARIEAEVSRMRLLVSDLLLLARMDEERPLVRRPVDLLEVAADAVSAAHVRVPARFVMLDGFGSLEPVTLQGDEPRIRQVVTNLLTNALQHTPENAKIVVRVGSLYPDSGPPPTATIGAPLPPGVAYGVVEVADTGPGMSAVESSRIFERLYRADRSRARGSGTGGAGLGLAIVAAIVTAHGGRVDVWTAPGEGARFRAWLPAIPDRSAPDKDGPADDAAAADAAAADAAATPS